MNLADLARRSRALAMVAMDQRESLRAMLGGAADAALVDFKRAVAEELSPHASAMLLDVDFGTAAMRSLVPSCALILAADTLIPGPSGSTADTALDDRVTTDDARRRGAKALKLLVVWKRDEGRERRLAMTRAFVERCRAGGLLSIVEGVVRVDDEALLLEAAREIGAVRPDLYKAEVPRFGKASPAELVTACERLGQACARPWVVLSSGVASADFAKAVEAACRGGASGFLAGRGVWKDAVGKPDVRAHLRDVAAPRLRRLGEIVDRYARPLA